MAAASKKAGAMRKVGDVVLWWLERIEHDREKSDSYKKNMRSMVRCHILPAIGALPVSRLSRRVLDQKLVERMRETVKASVQQKAFQALRQAFLMAEETGRIKANPMASLTFKSFYRGSMPTKPANLSRFDLPHLVKFLSSNFERDPVKGLLPLMMLAHGTRLGETLRAQWSHVFFDQRAWVLPELNCKSRKQHILPLTPQVLALLSRYRRALPDARAKVDWVFPVRGGSRLSDTSASAMFRELSHSDWSSHDLRKLMRDCLADLGVDYFIGERLVNHSLGKVSETYLTRDVMDRCREALELWHARLDECGFSIAHGLNSAAPASSQNPEKLEPAGFLANS